MARGKSIFRVRRFKSLTPLLRHLDALPHAGHAWAFRGLSNVDYGLKTTFERAAIERFGLKKAVYERELGLLRKFRRHAHQFIQHLPEPEERIEWLTLMQHYGAPTRLLDWTYSHHVALYFAVRDARAGTPSAIWAIDTQWLADVAIATLPVDLQVQFVLDRNMKQHELSNEVLWRATPVKCVLPLNSFNLNARQSVQQGLFLAPGDVGVSFEANLRATVRGRRERQNHLRCFIIETSRPFLRRAFEHLNRVNVTSASMFPGLEGFAEHLSSLLPHAKALAIDEWERP